MAESGRTRWLTLAGMTLANSMILVDQTAVPLAIPDAVLGLDASSGLGQWILTANVLPLAAFLVLGGRLGDLLGLRRVFLAGAITFIASSALAGAAQSIEWLIAVRAIQGIGAALMVPTSIALVSNAFSGPQRGRALGTLAGASAFFAALGPVLGGMLTSLDWRAVFFINVPLAAATIAITLIAVPATAPSTRQRVDIAGALLLALGLGLIVFGLGQSDDWGLTSAGVLLSVGGGVAALAVFVWLELRKRAPLVELGLFRHLNFAAANLSQTLAGMIELGMGYIMPFYLLLVLELDPVGAGLALLPASIPIVVVAPLVGRWFDRSGGRAPMTLGFLVLAASGVWFFLFAGERDLLLMTPGLILQGIGLGIVLTVNDPTGLNSVPAEEQGEGAGIINTTEQLGGALGIAGLGALLIGTYRADIDAKIAEQVGPGATEAGDRLRGFIERGEQTGLRPEEAPAGLDRILIEAGESFVRSFELTMGATAVIGIVGAALVWFLVRQGDRVEHGPIFSRRSRWVWASSGHGAGMTRKPPPRERRSAER